MLYGIDISHYQEAVDFELLYAAGIRVVIIKASEGSSFIDPSFTAHIAAAKKAGLRVGVYHWCNPTYSAASQMDLFLKTTDPFFPDFYCLDMEQWWKDINQYLQAVQGKIPMADVARFAPEAISQNYQATAEYLLARTAKKILIYTSVGFVSSWAPGMAKWMAKFFQWIANYPNGTPPAVTTWDELLKDQLPKKFAPYTKGLTGTVVIWQCSGDFYKAPGVWADAARTKLSALDINLIDMTEQEFDDFLGESTPHPEPAPTPVSTTKPITTGLIIADAGLNVRFGPGTTYDVVGHLGKGANVEIAEISGDWLRLSDGRWICKQMNGQTYVQLSGTGTVLPNPCANCAIEQRLTQLEQQLQQLSVIVTSATAVVNDLLENPLQRKFTGGSRMTTPTSETPEQQASTPVQQAPDGFIEIARYNGLVRKVEQLTLDNRALNEQLTAKASETEQLRSQLGIKDTEKTVAVGERDKQLQEAVQGKLALEKELAALRAFKLKVDTAKGMNRPELLRIVDKLPDMTDAEALKVVMQDFAGFADEIALQREKQILAGVTPPLGSIQQTQAGPASEAEWDKHINSLPLGSPERQKAFDTYWTWLNEKHKTR